MIKILIGDVLEQLATLNDASVQMVCTSPPYWGLRDYGTARWEGGDEGCDHVERKMHSKEGSTLHRAGWRKGENGAAPYFENLPGIQYHTDCGKCGAIRIDSQIGLEKTPELFVAKMVEVFRAVRRVLRDDGTCWVNLGDSYAGGAGGRGDSGNVICGVGTHKNKHDGQRIQRGLGELKPKDLCMIPARVALALQADGWWLRSDIIWSKPNPMPESVTDRPTKAHEYIFLLSKRERYFFDADALKEPATYAGKVVTLGEKSLSRGQANGIGCKPSGNGTADSVVVAAGRNIRTVWEIATQSFPDAHFATFPEDIPKRCILAGTSARGCCPNCSAPWERVTETSRTFESGSGKAGNMPVGKNGSNLQGGGDTLDIRRGPVVHSTTTGWQPTCACGLEETKPCTILDPFAGSGTTLKVAIELGRQAIGIELNPDYAAMIERRCQTTLGLPL